MAAEAVAWSTGLERELHALSESYLDRATDVVLTGMQRRIPRSSDGSHGRPAGYAASRLRVLARGRDSAGPFRDVGTDARTPDGYCYPIGLEFGTKPHVIRSKGSYPLRNARTGQVFGPVVFHPGTRPYPWARPAANDLAGRRL